ncbi:acyltransferase [Streptomyces sp. TRM 70361]|uniref:acyltransferase family protein n=1 Tax=Streptomyces sp. TRM 70361 TaxID=3116553 RepID=UPI002E7C18B3|nr:acyltransferase [Streptomyces sp. TRM 70361]MEE1938140.1 acyltransferase [Streptomyces sp. TRM 70361]
MTTPSRDRLPSLTGLRFWAALFVVVYHLSRQVGVVPGISEAAWYGRSGVTFFFVLSGFVLAWTYQGNMVSTTVFLWRRAARVWPLHAATTALSVGVYVLIGAAVSLKAVAASLLLVHAWSPEPVVFKGGNPAAWSLSDEAWFYLVFPALLLLLAARRSRVWLWTAVAVSAGAVLVWLASSQIDDRLLRLWFLDYFPLTRSLQFVLGVVAGLAVKRGWHPPVSLPWAAALVAGWHLALIPWSNAVPDALWYSPYTASQFLSAPLFTLLVAAAAHADLRGARTYLGSPWMIRLGHWSFAWYLVHEIVIRTVLHLMDARPESTTGTAAVWLLVIVSSLALAGLCYQFLEHPAERWLRRHGPSPAPRPTSLPSGTGRSTPREEAAVPANAAQPPAAAAGATPPLPPS